jgi:hypothetical protein
VHVTSYGIPSNAMIVFWKAMAHAMEAFLMDQWFLPIAEGERLTVGEAWTTLCSDLLQEIVTAFGKVRRKGKSLSKGNMSPAAQAANSVAQTAAAAALAAQQKQKKKLS